MPMSSSPNHRFRAGLSSFAWTWSVGVDDARPERALDEHDLVDAARALGAEVLQLADNTQVAARTDSALAELRAHASGAGVALEVGGRGLDRARLLRHVAVCRALGAGFLRFVIDAPGHEPDPDEVVALLRDVRSVLRDAEVVVGLENHDRLTASHLRAVVEAVDDPRVGICLDTVNSFGSGEGLGEVLPVLGPLTVNLHVKDWTVRRRAHGMGFEVRGARLGTGALDLPALLTEVARHGRCTAAVLEQWAPEAPTPERAAAEERAWLESSMPVLLTALEAVAPAPTGRSQAR